MSCEGCKELRKDLNDLREQLNGRLDSLIRLILLNHSKMDLFMRTIEAGKFCPNSMENFFNGTNPLPSIFPQFFSPPTTNFGSALISSAGGIPDSNGIPDPNGIPDSNGIPTGIEEDPNPIEIDRISNPIEIDRIPNPIVSPAATNSPSTDANPFSVRSKRISSNSNASTSTLFGESRLQSGESRRQFGEFRRRSGGGGGGSTAEEQQACPICAKILRNRVLKQHLRYVHGTPSQRCDHCARVFSRISDLRRHVRCVHEIEKSNESALLHGEDFFTST